MKLHYDEAGSGPLVVLLHGFPEFRISWKRQLPALAAAGFHAVAPDLRGYGQSPAPRGIGAYQMSEVCGDVAELIESLGGSCVLVGHDWGAAAAWYVAALRPELVRKLVILNVPHPAAIAREFRRGTRQKFNLVYQLFFQLPVLPELFMRAFGRMLLHRAANFTRDEIDTYARHWRTHLTPMLNYYRALRRKRPRLPRIDARTLVIHAEREPVFVAAAFEGLEQWVPNVRVEHVPGAGHFVQHDAADRVNELLLATLAD